MRVIRVVIVSPCNGMPPSILERSEPRWIKQFLTNAIIK